MMINKNYIILRPLEPTTSLGLCFQTKCKPSLFKQAFDVPNFLDRIFLLGIFVYSYDHKPEKMFTPLTVAQCTSNQTYLGLRVYSMWINPQLCFFSSVFMGHMHRDCIGNNFPPGPFL